MSKPILSHLDFGGVARIQNLPNGASPQEPATVAQLNAAIEGVSWKNSVRVRTGSNVNLASPGATLDGVTMVTGDRFLAAAQTAGAENGIYIWNGAASAAARAADCSTALELEQAVTTVEEGTSAGATFRQTVVNLTLGTTTVTWTAFGTSAPTASETTAGILEIATQAEVDAGADDARSVTPAKLAAWASRPRRHEANVGDGSATQFDLTHGFNTLDVQVEVVRVADGVSVWCDVARTSVNVVRLNFQSAPTLNQYRVLIHR
jgi:hypothetical protein